MTPDQYTLYIILACVIAIIYSLRRIYLLESKIFGINKRRVKLIRKKKR